MRDALVFVIVIGHLSCPEDPPGSEVITGLDNWYLTLLAASPSRQIMSRFDLSPPIVCVLI